MIYSSWGCRESDTTGKLTLSFSLLIQLCCNAWSEIFIGSIDGLCWCIRFDSLPFDCMLRSFKWNVIFDMFGLRSVTLFVLCLFLLFFSIHFHLVIFIFSGCCGDSVHFSHLVVSDSLQPHGLQHARLPCPSPTPGACSNSCDCSSSSDYKILTFHSLLRINILLFILECRNFYYLTISHLCYSFLINYIHKLRMSLFQLDYWRIFLLDMKFWVDNSFLSKL